LFVFLGFIQGIITALNLELHADHGMFLERM
jgi:hypothetical protein